MDHGTSTTVTYTDPSTGAAVTSTQTITTDPVSGGTTVENTQTATSTETTTTATFYDKEGAELVFNNGKWVYKATMSTVKEGREQGDIDLEFLTPSTMILNGKSWVVNRHDSTVKPTDVHSAPAGYEWLYDGTRGEGADSNTYGGTLMVHTSEADHSDAHMFKLTMGSGTNAQTLYVYCVDFATTSIPNYYKMENVKDSDAYDESERRHIQAIAKYGYWGNSDPADEEEAKTGSLAAISCGR